MYVYLSTKFYVSSKLLTSFRQGLILPPLHKSKNKPLKTHPD